MTFQWEAPTHSRPSSRQICDVDGHRLYAYRTVKGKKEFSFKLDGVQALIWSNTIDDIKKIAERYFLKRFRGVDDPTLYDFDMAKQKEPA